VSWSMRTFCFGGITEKFSDKDDRKSQTVWLVGVTLLVKKRDLEKGVNSLFKSTLRRVQVPASEDWHCCAQVQRKDRLGQKEGFEHP
jgi:hypothetical protein